MCEHLAHDLTNTHLWALICVAIFEKGFRLSALIAQLEERKTEATCRFKSG